MCAKLKLEELRGLKVLQVISHKFYLPVLIDFIESVEKRGFPILFQFKWSLCPIKGRVFFLLSNNKKTFLL